MQYKIKELREKRGWSQAKLARLSGVSRANIIRLENYPDVETSTTTLKAIADAFGVSIKYLFMP